MKIFNKIVWSDKAPDNKTDIWFDGESFLVYLNGRWRVPSGIGSNPNLVSEISRLKSKLEEITEEV